MPAALPPTSMRVSTTAGAAASTVQKSRELGSADSFSWPKLVAVVVAVTSTTGDSPVTVTVSSSVATRSSVFTVAVKPRPTRTASRMTVPNPASSYVMRYSPGGMAGKR
ncbi:MAG: hypothetical protein R2712_13850 [Vicinamibacterales bacterium]